jgi:hypothetical protein
MLTLNDFDGLYYKDSITKLKLHLHSYIIALVNNIHVDIVDFPEIRLDHVYLFDTDAKLRFLGVWKKDVNIHTEMLDWIRSFLKRYVNLLTSLMYDSGQLRINPKSNNSEQQEED